MSKDFLTDLNSVLADRVHWLAEWRIYKFRDPNDEIANLLKAGKDVKEIIAKFPGAFMGFEYWKENCGLNTGLQNLVNIICGLNANAVKWDAGNARLGVGDNNAAAAASQTGLLSASNTAFQAMNSNYPSRTNQTAEWNATFGSSVANFHWQEYIVDNGATAAIALNRCTADKGTKSSGETWTLDLQVSFS
jgi:hypothetical protein